MTANAGVIRARLELSNAEFKRKMDETREDMKSTSRSAEQLTIDLGFIMKASLAVGGAIASAIGGSVKIAADFEASMARVKAISGATDEEFARLEKTAREMGAATIFSASEAAEGLSYLAMAGFTVNEQIDALPAVLNAAIAGQIELGQSADIVSNIMTGFGIAAEEAGRAVDVLVRASVTANTDLPMLGDGMKYVAPVAASLGWSIEETAAAIGKLSDAGIQGSQSGTVLRASLLALANPTGQTEKAIERLNIELLDANGNMKPMPELMGHIAESMEGMTDAQKTQTAAQLVGTQAAAGFIALLEVGEEGLADYVTELENSAGAAQEMADIQADTLTGSFKEFQSAVEEAGIKLGNEFLPLFTDVIRTASGVVNSFDEVNAGQVKTALVFGGTAAAIGGTIATVGKLALAVSGLLAAMGPAGWLIVGVSLLGGAVAALSMKMREKSEVSLDLVNSLTEQADVLEENVNQFDELRSKSQLSNEEFARMIDIQKELEQTQNPARVEKLQTEYEKLREQSGLSNEELTNMISLNNDIITQSPSVEKSFTEKGNAVIESTAAVREYVQSLRDMALEELKIEQAKAFEARAELLEESIEAAEKIATIEERMNKLVEARKIPLEEVSSRLEDINQKMDTGLLTQEEYLALEEEQSVLLQVQNRMVAEALQNAQDKKEELQKTVDLYDEESAKLAAVNEKIIEAYLAEVDINYEKGEGLKKLDERIKKLTEEKKQLMENISEEDKRTGKLDDQIRKLDSQISQHSEIKGKITDNIRESEKLTEELAKDVKKDVDVDDKGKAQQIHDKASEPATKHVSIFERVRRFITGETKHGGGIVGDGTSTGVTRPRLHTGGIANYDFTPIINEMRSLPMHNEIDVRLLQNEMVLTEGQQANLWRILQGAHVPQNTPVTSNSRVEALLRELITAVEEGQDVSIMMDGRRVGELVEPHITRKQERDEINKSRARGY